MREDKLTLEGMQQSVRDSDVFLLVLSAHMIASWFCKQEMLCAIEGGTGKRMIKSLSGGMVEVPPPIC